MVLVFGRAIGWRVGLRSAARVVLLSFLLPIPAFLPLRFLFRCGRRGRLQAQVPRWSIFLGVPSPPPPYKGAAWRSSTRGAEAEEGRSGRLPRDAPRARAVRTLVRGSAEARRPHSLLRLRTRLPSLGSRNFAPPEDPSLHQPGGHTGGQDRRGETLCLPAWPARRVEIFSQAAIFFDGQTTPLPPFLRR
ncbi:hypothetical protein NDU88_001488 [Pleurodeles waltl]|uniref:Uncharacterized protein n=1 Tax=Pleurodeles waltl TaxID=8319 RepID=A0AAV7UUV8_PLEWA|nr:hypothetical protein NDU88_001488 [Pleurodeles waltl]